MVKVFYRISVELVETEADVDERDRTIAGTLPTSRNLVSVSDGAFKKESGWAAYKAIDALLRGFKR